MTWASYAFERYILFYYGWMPVLLQATVVTVELAVTSILLGITLGLVVALCRLSGSRLPRTLAYYYALVVRGTPLLVQIIIVYFWFPQLGIDLGSKFVSGMLALGINYGAYISEIIRAGLESIDKGQMEAARSLGMSHGLALRRIIIPQAAKRLIPPLGNEFIAMLKDTALVSVIGMNELLRAGEHVANSRFRGDILLVVALIYLGLTSVFSFVAVRVEKALGVYE